MIRQFLTNFKKVKFIAKASNMRYLRSRTYNKIRTSTTFREKTSSTNVRFGNPWGKHSIFIHSLEQEDLSLGEDWKRSIWPPTNFWALTYLWKEKIKPCVICFVVWWRVVEGATYKKLGGVLNGQKSVSIQWKNISLKCAVELQSYARNST